MIQLEMFGIIDIIIRIGVFELGKVPIFIVGTWPPLMDSGSEHLIEWNCCGPLLQNNNPKVDSVRRYFILYLFYKV